MTAMNVVRTVSYLLISMSVAPLQATPKVLAGKLSNGLQYRIAELKEANTARLRLWVKAGSAHEQPGKTSVAHLIEHLMFGEFSKNELPYFTQAKTKGRVNGHTRHLATVFSVDAANKHLEFFLGLEGRRLAGAPVLTAARVAKEIETIKAEHSRNYQQNSYILWRKFFQKGFNKTPFSWHTSGNPGDLSKISVKDVQDFYHRYYRPDNTCLSVVSNRPLLEVESLIKKNFSLVPKRKNHPSKIRINQPTGAVIDISDEPVSAIIGFRFDQLKEESQEQFDLLNFIFAGSQNSLLKKSIRFQLKKDWDYGELNYDYDWYNVKALITSVDRLSRENLIALAATLNKVASSLTPKQIENYKQEFQLEQAESLQKSTHLADHLVSYCGKYINTTTTGKSLDTKSVQNSLKRLFSEKNLVIVSMGDSK